MLKNVIIGIRIKFACTTHDIIVLYAYSNNTITKKYRIKLLFNLTK